MAGIGVGLDIISSAINNYNNDNLTTGQKWASFGADAGYYVVKGALSYAAGSLLTSGAVALGTAAGCTAIYFGAGFFGASLIAGGIVAVPIVGGTILIAVLSDALDNWWKKKKEEWFN